MIALVFWMIVTFYNPSPKQCQGNHLITADGSKIDLQKLEKGELKWIAISRDLECVFPMGSKVKVSCKEHPEINGIYEVHDRMNKRYSKTIDILIHKKENKKHPKGKYTARVTKSE